MQAPPLSYRKTQDHQSREKKLQTPMIKSHLAQFTRFMERNNCPNLTREGRWNHKVLFCKNILKF